jgi:DNA anti-recombination protein RmuC
MYAALTGEIMREVGEESALGAAVIRLERALTLLEQKTAERLDEQPDMFGALRKVVAAEAERKAWDEERAALSNAAAAAEAERDAARGELDALRAELSAARDREKALEEAGSQASAALGRAINEIRAALGDEPADGQAPAEQARAEEESAAWPS